MTYADNYELESFNSFHDTGHPEYFTANDVKEWLKKQGKSENNSGPLIAQLVNSGRAVRTNAGRIAEYQLTEVARLIQDRIKADDAKAKEPEAELKPRLFKEMIEEKQAELMAAETVDDVMDIIGTVAVEIVGSNPDDVLRTVTLKADQTVIIQTVRDKLKNLIYTRFQSPESSDEKSSRAGKKRIEHDKTRQAQDTANMHAMLRAIAADSNPHTNHSSMVAVLRALLLSNTETADGLTLTRDAVITIVDTMAINLDDIFGVITDLMENLAKNQDAITNRVNNQNSAIERLIDLIFRMEMKFNKSISDQNVEINNVRAAMALMDEPPRDVTSAATVSVVQPVQPVQPVQCNLDHDVLAAYRLGFDDGFEKGKNNGD